MSSIDQFIQKHYSAEAQVGRFDIEDINVRVQPSTFYFPIVKETVDHKDENYINKLHDEADCDDDSDNENYKPYKPKTNLKSGPTEKIKEYLLNFKQTGVFSCGGVLNNVPLPGIHINDIGIVGLPLGEEQGKNIADKYLIASFGKNEETITDTNIQHTWQLDPSQFTIQNSSWDSAMKSVVHQVSCKLGCDSKSVKHNLYKLLIYGPGSFFEPHRDTEKEKGMFGTLIVTLPSLYSGGQLIVKHCGGVSEYDFSDKNSFLETNYTAFYADCEYEIRPITSGYRVCLVYNLISTEPNVMPTTEDNTEIVHEIAEWPNSEDRCPELLIYGLEDRYTDAELSFDNLKGKDVAILKLLKEVSSLAPLDIYLVNFLKYDNNQYAKHSTTTTIKTWVSETGIISIKRKEEKKVEEGEEEDDKEEELFDIYENDFVQEYFWESKTPDIDITDRLRGQPTHMQFYYHTGIAFWPRQYKHLLFLRKSIDFTIEYMYNSDEKNDVQVVFSFFLKKLKNQEFFMDTKHLEDIVEILIRFDLKEQAIKITSYVQENIQRFYNMNQFIRAVSKLYKSFPIISTSPGLSTIARHMINQSYMWSRIDNNSAQSYNKKVIAEFKEFLDEEPGCDGNEKQGKEK